MDNHYYSIVVAVDGSIESEYAFRKALDIVKRNKDSWLSIVHIIDTRAAAVYDRMVLENAQKDTEELLNKYKNEAVSAGVEQVKTVVEFGSPRSMITKDLNLNADLIVCGAHGRNAVERYFIGSVSESIVRSAKCDVLVVRTPESLK
ncbi:universal stress protein [Chungangia koreensis]|uniref:Universal stress protein n=1 Tax=Chungangia koreensis TaxID=752657 RepID=A0ABV8X3R6_9LACT